MKRFDVCSAARFEGSGKERLVVVLQHEGLEELHTTVAAPLFKPSELPPLPTLRPTVVVGRQRLVVAIDRMASLPKRQLGKPVGNLETAHFELLRAIDMLFSGF